MREEKTFRVVVFRFETDASTNYTRYMITKNYMPFFPGNQWLELKSIRKTSTGKEYAKKLVAFLNWLDSRKVTYENATNHHVREFLHELVFGNLADEKVLSLFPHGSRMGVGSNQPYEVFTWRTKELLDTL